ncbi:hypothetical protein TCAL_15297 [Tigriopus californicus]|uniref:Uncharacterized protein n=1 Tax=Tigriopus californicus TaxID=6832 RepID=A0A553PKB7_TIGCA|nr:hypothetical protein TCAL_15297 [Tigriopus californicus]
MESRIIYRKADEELSTSIEPEVSSEQGFQRQVQQSLAKLRNRLIDQEIELEENRAILEKSIPLPIPQNQ